MFLKARREDVTSFPPNQLHAFLLHLSVVFYDSTCYRLTWQPVSIPPDNCSKQQENSSKRMRLFISGDNSEQALIESKASRWNWFLIGTSSQLAVDPVWWGRRNRAEQ